MRIFLSAPPSLFLLPLQQFPSCSPFAIISFFFSPTFFILCLSIYPLSPFQSFTSIIFFLILQPSYYSIFSNLSLLPISFSSSSSSSINESKENHLITRRQTSRVLQISVRSCDCSHVKRDLNEN